MQAAPVRQTDRQTDKTSTFVRLDVAAQRTERILAKFGLEAATVRLLGTKLWFVSVEYTA